MGNGGVLTNFADSEIVEEMTGRTDALLSRGIENETLGPIAYTSVVGVNDEAQVKSARNALACRVNDVSRWAHALQIFIQDESFAGWTRFHCKY